MSVELFHGTALPAGDSAIPVSSNTLTPFAVRDDDQDVVHGHPRLRELQAKRIVRGDEIEIRGKTHAAVALLAQAPIRSWRPALTPPPELLLP